MYIYVYVYIYICIFIKIHLENGNVCGNFSVECKNLCLFFLQQVTLLLLIIPDHAIPWEKKRAKIESPASREKVAFSTKKILTKHA